MIRINKFTLVIFICTIVSFGIQISPDTITDIEFPFHRQFILVNTSNEPMTIDSITVTLNCSNDPSGVLQFEQTGDNKYFTIRFPTGKPISTMPPTEERILIEPFDTLFFDHVGLQQCIGFGDSPCLNQDGNWRFSSDTTLANIKFYPADGNDSLLYITNFGNLCPKVIQNIGLRGRSNRSDTYHRYLINGKEIKKRDRNSMIINVIQGGKVKSVIIGPLGRFSDNGLSQAATQ